MSKVKKTSKTLSIAEKYWLELIHHFGRAVTKKELKAFVEMMHGRVVSFIVDSRALNNYITYRFRDNRKHVSFYSTNQLSLRRQNEVDSRRKKNKKKGTKCQK